VRSQLERLAEPVKSKYVSQVTAGGGREADYVAHSVITELLLYVCGPFDYEITQTIRNGDIIEGCLARLTVDVDGRRTSITEAGDITGQEKNNGERMKNASSDALKRCAMRLGLGLHLWAQSSYFLDDALAARRERMAGDGSCVECGRADDDHAPICSRRPM